MKLQRVRVGNDDGSTVEVLEGLHGGEYVALNLGTRRKGRSAERAAQLLRR